MAITAPGYYTLGILSLTTAATYTSDELEDMEGVTGISAQFQLVYGSGGTTAKAYLQTTLDQGDTWFDIACATFTTASATKVFGIIRGAANPAAMTQLALTDNTCLAGILGPKFRYRVVTTGTYADDTKMICKLDAV